MKNLFVHLITGFLALYLATFIIPGVETSGGAGNEIRIILAAGITLGIANYFIRPLINIITIPLRILTFGLFGIIINMLIVWGIDILFPELIIFGIWPIFWTGLLVWALDFIASKILLK